MTDGDRRVGVFVDGQATDAQFDGCRSPQGLVLAAPQALPGLTVPASEPMSMNSG